MPVRSNVLERAAFRLNLAPGVMTDFLAAEGFHVLAAAHRLGVFRALAGGPLDAGELARRLETDERGTRLLLDALEALGYLRRRLGRFRASPMTQHWLPVLGEGLPFFEHLADRMREVDEAVRRGGPRVAARAWFDAQPDGWREFEAGMVALARMSLREVTARVSAPPAARRLLDVGGGHGLHALELCRRHPRLSATVFDLPQALTTARDIVAAEGMAERVTLRAGDFWVDDLGAGYDVALLFNIIHGIAPEKNAELLARVAAALVPGGVVVILDQLAGRVIGPTARAVAALNGLTQYTIDGGQTYAFAEVAGWLRATGFRRVRRSRLLSFPGSWLVTAERRVDHAAPHP